MHMEQVYKQWKKNGKNIVVLEYIRLDIIMKVFIVTWKKKITKFWNLK